MRIFASGQSHAHGDLLGRCLTLMSSALKQDMCDLRIPGTLARDIRDSVIRKYIAVDVRYACSYWFDHLLQIGVDLGRHANLLDDGSLHAFFQHNLLYWLESLSLVGNIFRGVSALIKIGEILQVSMSNGL